ncbi:MAG: sigma factor [Bryobacteraceae bacterium]
MNDDLTLRRQRVIETSKLRGYALYAEIAALLPEDSSDGPGIDEILAWLDREGVDLLEAKPQPIWDFTEWSDDPVAFYLREVAALPPLTPDRERILTERTRGNGPEAEVAKKDLVAGCLLRVVYVALHYTSVTRHILYLIQDGNETLMKAVNNFDSSRGYRFSAYATWHLHRLLSRVEPPPSQK